MKTIVSILRIPVSSRGRFDKRAALSLIGFLCIACTRPAFAQLNHAQPEWYLPTGDGCSLFVQEFGQGPETIVVLHGGWGAEHSYLLDIFKRLDERYHLVFYDQRGSLLSPCSPEKISVQKHVEDLERLRAALGLERMNFVAHSMGTFLAMEYLQQHPDHVKGLVLMGSLPPRAPGSDTEKKLAQVQQSALQQFMTRPEIAAELKRQSLDRDEKTLTPKQGTNEWRIHFAGVNIFHIARWQEVKGGRGFYSAAAGQAAAKTMPQQWDFVPALAAHHCTTWVIDGDYDYVDGSARMFQEATASAPGLHFVVLKNAGHLSWIDDPKKFAKAFRSALASTTSCQ